MDVIGIAFAIVTGASFDDEPVGASVVDHIHLGQLAHVDLSCPHEAGVVLQHTCKVALPKFLMASLSRFFFPFTLCRSEQSLRYVVKRAFLWLKKALSGHKVAVFVYRGRLSGHFH